MLGCTPNTGDRGDHQNPRRTQCPQHRTTAPTGSCSTDTMMTLTPARLVMPEQYGKLHKRTCSGVHGQQTWAASALSDRDDDHMQGQLLAGWSKRVTPCCVGGVELRTRTLLARRVTDADSSGTGLERTAAEILARSPRSYVGAESDPANLVGTRSRRPSGGHRRGVPDYPTPAVSSSARRCLTMQGNAD